MRDPNSALTKKLSDLLTELDISTSHRIHDTISSHRSLAFFAFFAFNMSDPSLYTYDSPLKGYEGLEPLPKYVV